MKVTVYNQVGQSKKEVEFPGTTWGQLQETLMDAGVPFAGMKAVIGENQNSLDMAGSVVPTNDWTLFLVPNKVESGMDDYGNDEDGDDYTSDDDDVDSNDDDSNSPALSIEKLEQIQKLTEASNLIAEVVAEIKKANTVISDPVLNDLNRKANEIMANLWK